MGTSGPHMRVFIGEQVSQAFMSTQLGKLRMRMALTCQGFGVDIWIGIVGPIFDTV